jgi:hypothetical protein
MTEAVVKPGETVPTNLKCAYRCPTASSLTNFVGSVINNQLTAVPYDSSSASSWSGISSPVAYTWDPAAYTLTSGSGAVTADLFPAKTATNYADFIKEIKKSSYEWNIRSGALVDAAKFTAGGDMDCAGSGGAGSTFCDWRANELSEYYTFETGIQDWNRATFLMSGSTPVSFTPPMDASYQVPSDTAIYGQYAGALMSLQFSGFGDLYFFQDFNKNLKFYHRRFFYCLFYSTLFIFKKRIF